MFNRIATQEIIDFAKNLNIMLKSGIAIDEALKSLAEQAKSKKFSRIISKVKKEVEMGISLSEAFAKEEKTFGKIFIVFLKAGEASGTLEKNLEFLADWIERNYDLKKQINSAMLYPKIVFAATLILGSGLAIFILPRLVPLFSQLNVELPFFTRILLNFSIFVERFWPLVLIAIAVIIIFFISVNRIKFIRRSFHFLYIRLPFFGNLLVDYQLTLISYLFSILLKSGIPLNELLNIAADVPTNLEYRDSIENFKKRILQGTNFSEALKGYPRLFPKTMVNIVATGEKSGTLEESFDYLAEFYSKEVNNKTKKLPTIIEPVLLIFIGLILGFVAISIIMPIYKLTSGLSR